jgi:DNA-binding Lrp family transcriptional regulator
MRLLKKQVSLLYDGGLDAVDIAEMLGLSIEKVENIIKEWVEADDDEDTEE